MLGNSGQGNDTGHQVDTSMVGEGEKSTKCAGEKIGMWGEGERVWNAKVLRNKVGWVR